MAKPQKWGKTLLWALKGEDGLGKAYGMRSWVSREALKAECPILEISNYTGL